ncbi:MAG: hypothetical protein J6P65_07325 [Bacteroidales bacterium]|nr:hypothetical protein [Bacteroidales bacterium]
MMSKLKFLLLFATVSGVSSFFNVSFGQSLTERVLWADTSDTLDTFELKKIATDFSFDQDGNFSFFLKKGKDETAITNKELPGNLCYAGGGSRNNGAIQFLRLCSKKDADFLYVKNWYGPDIYGPIAGDVLGYRSGNTHRHIAVTSLLGDTVFFYIDGQKIYSSQLDDFKQFKLSDEKWIDFSHNGNVIYYLEQDSRFVLYVNGQPIDSSSFRYEALSINDKGEYVYAKGLRPEMPVGKYDYMFFVHTKDTVFDYVRTAWQYALTENGAYFYSGDDCGPDYIVVNGRIKKGIESIRNIILVDSKNALFTFEKGNGNYLDVNGVEYPLDFDEIFCPTMDTNGHFAYYGLKKYYLYKVIDGKMVKEPLSKYGVRAMPLYLNVQGNSLHCFKTDDSIYVYQDNCLLFNPISSEKPFEVLSRRDVFPSNFYEITGRFENGHSLFCLNYGDSGYFVYDGLFSEAMSPIRNKWSCSISGHTVGAVEEGVFNEHGFFAVQYTGDKSYRVVVNNQVYQDLYDVDEIFSQSGFFDGKQVIFYGRKKNAIYQFIISL